MESNLGSCTCSVVHWTKLLVRWYLLPLKTDHPRVSLFRVICVVQIHAVNDTLLIKDIFPTLGSEDCKNYNLHEQ